MIVAPPAPGYVMSWPSMVGSLAATDSGLRATGDGDAAAAGEAAGEAAGFAATADGLAAAAATDDGLAATAGLADGEAAEIAGAAVGFAAVVAVGAGAAGAEQPSATSIVAVEA